MIPCTSKYFAGVKNFAEVRNSFAIFSKIFEIAQNIRGPGEDKTHKKRNVKNLLAKNIAH